VPFFDSWKAALAPQIAADEAQVLPPPPTVKGAPPLPHPDVLLPRAR
jgi:hypothetical protein